MKKDDIIESQIDYLLKTTQLANYHLTDQQVRQFKEYLIKLLLWNRRINLISKNDEKNVVARHFLESIAILDIIDFPMNSYLIDVGTGAGFPGLPLKIVRPDLNLTLLDSKRFKSLFLSDLLKTLNLPKVEVVKERAEVASLKPAFNQKFDFVVARAVTKLSTLFKWTNQFLKPAATLLALKGGDIEMETQALKKEFSSLTLKVLPLKSPLVNADRKIVVVQAIAVNKVDVTPLSVIR